MAIRRRGNPGLKGRLLEKSIEAYVLALETINRLSIKYRVETFCYLICNSWELLLKAKILTDTGSRESIYYVKRRGEPARSLSLRDCLKRVFTNENDPTRRNLELIADLRDESAHLIIGQVPRGLLCLFQASVLNYHKNVGEWFGVSLSERVPVGMMTIVYDLSPEKSDLSDPVMRRQLGKDTADYLTRFQAKLLKEFDQLKRPAEFCIDIEYRVVLTKAPDKADICLTTGVEGVPTRIVEVPKDPSVSHPYRQKELLEQLNLRLDHGPKINFFDIQSIKKAFGIRKRPDFFYQSKIKGSPGQYSSAFFEWIVKQFSNDADFFVKARRKAKARLP